MSVTPRWPALLAIALSLAPPVGADQAPMTDQGAVSLVEARAILEDPDAHSWRQLQELARVLDQGADRDPENVEMLVLAARAQVRVAGPVGEYKAAHRLEEALKRQPANGEALAQQALLLQRSGCAICAQDALDRARQRAPNDPWLHEAQGYALLTEGWQRLSEAIPARPGEPRKDYFRLGLAEYEAAIARHASRVRKGVIHRWIAGLHQRGGDREAAAAALEQVLTYLPEDPWALEQRAAAALYDRGDLETAGRLAARISDTRRSSEARQLAAAVMYGSWAREWSKDGDTERTRELLAAVRKAHRDTGEIFMFVSAAPQTAFIAKAMLAAGVFNPLPRDYRDKDGDTALASVVLNYQRRRLGERPGDAAKLIEVVDLLLAKGSNPNVWTSEQRVPLLAVAAHSGDADLFARLLAAGADPNLRAADDSTVLMAVAAVDDRAAAGKMAALLLAHDVDLAGRNEQGRSALHFAAGSGNVELLRILLARGVAVDTRDADEESPLDIAAFAGQREVAEALLAAGAEVLTHNTPCGWHTTADIAERAGHKGLAELLRSRLKLAS